MKRTRAVGEEFARGLLDIYTSISMYLNIRTCTSLHTYVYAIELTGAVGEAQFARGLLGTRYTHIYIYVSKHIYMHVIHTGAPLRLPKPLSEQLPVRVCSCPL